MRQALIESIGSSKQDRYPAESIVICVSCGRPVYRLERGIALGETAGRFIHAFVPVSPADLLTLRDRTDIDPGVRAQARAVTDIREYCDTIQRPTKGSPALCPKCDRVFVQTRSSESGDTIDRGYVWELSTIPPRGGAATLRGGDLWQPR